DQLVGEVDRIRVEDADPLDAVDLVQLAKQLGEAHAPVEIHAVVGRVLSDKDQFADAVGRKLAGFADDLLDRLGDMLAAHAGDGPEGAQPIAALRDFQIGIVAWRDPQAGRVFERTNGSGTKQRPLFRFTIVLLAGRHDRQRNRAVDDLAYLLAAKDADDL